MFESLNDVLHNKLKKIGAKKLNISEEFREFKSKDKKYTIKNWLFESPSFRKWRITKLDGGEKIQVFNTVAYPNFKCEQPILGVDILWFGNSQKLLTVLDYQPLIQDNEYLQKYCAKLNVIKNKYSEFDNTKMKRIYDSNKYFSPWVIICRGNKSNLDKDLHNIFYLFLAEYLKINAFFSENQFLNSQEIQSKHFEYDQYSADKDPADKLFKKFFGEEWTSKFIRNFLFTSN